jgi:hypothetical protein
MLGRVLCFGRLLYVPCQEMALLTDDAGSEGKIDEGFRSK